MARKALRWLLVLPFVATLLPPLYLRRAPVLFGFPFFYWYQILWVVLAAVIVAIVYRFGEPVDD